jgi:hypothetical protein
MKRIDHFVPGQPGEDEGVLARLRWSIPAGVTRAYVEAYTAPAETVVVPYCQGPTVVREVLAAERRVLALNFDPALLLAAQMILDPLPARELDAAVARLGDSVKQGLPLRRYLAELYASTCPACLRPGIADYFVWDREREAPIAKQLRCPACDWGGQTVVDAEDLERLNQTPAHEMHYHYVLDRVAPRPQGTAFRTRLEQLLGLYTGRNLYALAELTLRIESLFPTGRTNRALKALLLDCLDRCSSLTPLPSKVALRRGLSRPSRFLERNVWNSFEEAITRFQTPAARPLSIVAGTLETFQASGSEGDSFVGMGLVRDLPQHLAPRSIGLILTSPPPLSSAAWSLSYFWGAWLLGAEAVAPLRPLLRQRTPDPTWYARVMSGSFRNLAGLLRDDGRLVLVLIGQRPSVVEALLLAASQARMGVASLIQQGTDYRLELTPTIPQIALEASRVDGSAVPTGDLPVEAQIRRTTAATAVGTIRARGEPVLWPTLHAAILQRLAEAGLLAKVLEASGETPSPLDLIEQQVAAGLDDPALERIPEEGKDRELWWLSDPADAAPPLCDRVEAEAHQILQDTLILKEADFALDIYTRFPGLLTPDAGLVTACLRSFGRDMTPGHWQLRSEDLPDARQAECQSMVKHLLALGRRLAYRVAPCEPFDVAWLEGKEIQAVFAVRWRAALSEVLAFPVPAAGASPFLVIPGGRAELVSYKLSHNPLWQKAVDQAGWKFIKYRHVRQLAAQSEVDLYALQTIIGLDPIVEREQVQLTLF